MATKTEIQTGAAPIKKTKAARSKKMSAKVDKFFDKEIVASAMVEPARVDMAAEYLTAAPIIMPVESVSEEKKTIFSMLDKKLFFKLAIVLVMFSLIGISGYFYYQYKKAVAVDAGKNEIADFVSKIGKFMVLPEGEEPTMATVSDKEKLASQSFFAKAENGDKVLFFSKSQKAILYRPSSNMIIEATSMAGGIPSGTTQNPPAVVGQEQAAPVEQPVEQENQAEVQAQVVQAASVFVENGTSQKGLAKTMAEKISQIEGVTIFGTGNAEGDFTKTIVVDLSGKNEKIAQEIVKSIGGEIGILPEGEKKPDADILVILGNL